jgi:nucleotide-binding universal stress UspA family protein
VLDPLPYVLPESAELFSPEQRTRLESEIQKALAALRLRAETAGADHVETALREGHPPAVIARFAEEGGFDLMVMGTHGRRGLSHAVLGSVVERVMRIAPCPVLTVRAPNEKLTPDEEVWRSAS